MERGVVAPVHVDYQEDDRNRKALHQPDPLPYPVRHDRGIGNQLVLQVDYAASGSAVVGDDADMIRASFALLDGRVFKRDVAGRDGKACQFQKGGGIIAATSRLIEMSMRL